jgi:hypothetical protein
MNHVKALLYMVLRLLWKRTTSMLAGERRITELINMINSGHPLL